jgi:hypothetical protein
VESESYSSVEDLRAEVLQSVAEETRYEVISKPHTAVATVNIDPSAIPFDGCDKDRLVAAVAEHFGADYEPPKGVPPEAVRGASYEALMRASRANADWVRFRGGRLQLPGSERVTSITNMAFGEQNLTANVSGVTAEALHICRALCLLMWDSTGMPRRWAELADLVERETYLTTTIVELGIPLISVLGMPLRTFLAENVSGPGGFGQHMGGLIGGREGTLRVVPYCREIDIRVTVFDEKSGESDDCAVNLLLHTRGDANRSRVKVSSELESAQHNDMVVALVQTLARTDH